MCHRASKAPFTFLVNIIVPGNPPFHLVMSWAADASSFEGIETLSRCACVLGISMQDMLCESYERLHWAWAKLG